MLNSYLKIKETLLNLLKVDKISQDNLKDPNKILEIVKHLKNNNNNNNLKELNNLKSKLKIYK